MEETTYTNMLIRIKVLLRERKITQKQLAEAVGIGTWTLTKQLRGIYKLNMDIILTVLQLCPDVSADWLILGRGYITRADVRDIAKE